LRHDQIVSGLAELVPALVPIRFGTLANRDDLASLDAATVEHCADLLERVRDRQEWGLRLMTTSELPASGRAEAASGADYLAGVRDRQRSRREAATRREAAVAALLRELDSVSDEAAQLSARRPGQLANLAYLVRRDRAGVFHDRVKQASASLRSCGVEAVVTGPWAPYSFTELGAAS
jgi:hypothetical protein